MTVLSSQTDTPFASTALPSNEIRTPLRRRRTLRSRSLRPRSRPKPRPLRPAAPVVKVLKPPDFWGSNAPSGVRPASTAPATSSSESPATTTAARARRIYSNSTRPPSTFTDRGNVVSELERLGLRRPGETQMKIHSRIVTAVDGYQYFASMDETGENDDGSKTADVGRASVAPWTNRQVGASRGHAGGTHRGRHGRPIRLRARLLQSRALSVRHPHQAHSVGRGRVGRRAREPELLRRRPRSRVRVDASATPPPAAPDRRAGGVRHRASKSSAAQPLGEYFEGSPHDSHGIVAVAAGRQTVAGTSRRAKGGCIARRPNPAATFDLSRSRLDAPGRIAIPGVDVPRRAERYALRGRHALPQWRADVRLDSPRRPMEQRP